MDQRYSRNPQKMSTTKSLDSTENTSVESYDHLPFDQVVQVGKASKCVNYIHRKN